MALDERRNSSDGLNLLRPEALGRLGRLQFIARGVVEGFVTGRHRSPYKGFSAEFAEHRQYVPGDDVRDLDWRVYGRNDRYYVKQFIDETNLRATILLDASGSMAYAGDRASPVAGRVPSKFEYGRYVAASMAHLMIHQQDAVGLVTFDRRVRRYIPARSRPMHLRIVLDELAATRAGDETALAPVLHDIAERIHRRGLVMLISDLFADVDAILEALHHFRHRKHEVVVFQVLADEELTFPFQQWTDFHGLEQPDRNIRLDPRAVRAEYLARFEQFQRRLRTDCGRMKIDCVTLCTRDPYDNALAVYLAGRQQKVKG
mgnify:CR=1 FL=1